MEVVQVWTKLHTYLVCVLGADLCKIGSFNTPPASHNYSYIKKVFRPDNEGLAPHNIGIVSSTLTHKKAPLGQHRILLLLQRYKNNTRSVPAAMCKYGRSLGLRGFYLTSTF